MEWIADKRVWEALGQTTQLLLHQALHAFTALKVSLGIGSLILFIGIWVAVACGLLRDLGGPFLGNQAARRGIRKVEAGAALVILPLALLQLLAHYRGH